MQDCRPTFAAPRNHAAGPTYASSIGPDDVHVWHLAPDDGGTCESVCADLLSSDERTRLARLRAASVRQQYLAAHILLRRVLSHYAAVEPNAWVFTTNRHGRPEISAPGGTLPLRFNLSHTHGLVACAVTLERDVGVDIEAVRHRPRALDVARRFFAPAEIEVLVASPREQQAERFFEYWTLKESYIKARGVGLALPLRRFAFDLTDTASIRIAFAPGFGDDAACWQFGLCRPTAQHVLAVCARRTSGQDLQIVLRGVSTTWLDASRHQPRGV